MQAIAKTIDTADEDMDLTLTYSVAADIADICESDQNLTAFKYLDVADRNSLITWSNDQCLAAIFIANADQKRHGKLATKLHSDCLLGSNSHPASFTNAFSLFLNFEPTRKTSVKLSCGGDDNQ